MRIAGLLWAMICLLLPTYGWAKSQAPLKVATFEMPPYISEASERGYLRETLTAVFQQLDRDLQFEFYPYLRAPKIVESNVADILAPAFTDTTQSEKFVYTDPLLESDFGFVSLNRTQIRQEPLEGRDLIAAHLKEQLSTDMILKQLDMLSSGRLDQIYLEKHIAAEILVSKRPALIQKLNFVKDERNQLRFRIAIRKSRPDHLKLRDDFNQALRLLKSKGRIDHILENRGYFDYKNEAGTLNIAAVDDANTQLLQEMSMSFLKTSPKVKLRWSIASSEDLRLRILRSMVYKTSVFDVISVQGFDASVFASHEWTTPFENLDKSWDEKDIVEDIKRNLIYKGKFVALPVAADVSLIYYRTDLFAEKKLKIALSPRLDEIRKLASTLHAPMKKQYGVCMLGEFSGGENLSLFYALAVSNGGRWLGENWKPQLNTAPWVEALTQYTGLLTDFGPPDPSRLDSQANEELFSNGHCAMWLSMSSSLARLRDPVLSKVGKKLAVVRSPFLKSDEGSNWAWIWSLAVPSTSQNKELAQKFVQWASSRDYVQTVAERRGWSRAPAGLRYSTQSHQEFKKAEPFGDFILETIQAQRFPKDTAPTEKRAEILLFFEIWPAIGYSLGDRIHDVLAKKISPQEALDKAQIDAMRVMYQSGFYSPPVPSKVGR